MRKLIITFSLLFIFSIAGNAMTNNVKSIYSQSFLDEKSSEITFFADQHVNADTTDKEFKIESIQINALGDSCTVTIKGQNKILGKTVDLTISPTAATCEKASEMAFNGVKAIKEEEN